MRVWVPRVLSRDERGGGNRIIVGNTEESKSSVQITFVSSMLLFLLSSALPLHGFPLSENG